MHKRNIFYYNIDLSSSYRSPVCKYRTNLSGIEPMRHLRSKKIGAKNLCCCTRHHSNQLYASRYYRSYSSKRSSLYQESYKLVRKHHRRRSKRRGLFRRRSLSLAVCTSKLFYRRANLWSAMNRWFKHNKRVCTA